MTTLAVSGYDWIKTAHVLGAVIWAGGSTLLTILVLLTQRQNDPEGLLRLGKLAGTVGQYVFANASLVTAGFGFWLAENGNWGYGHFWVVFAIVGWGIAGATGALFFGPQTKRLNALAADRGATDPQVQAALRRLIAVARLDVALQLAIVVVMTLKP